MKFLALCGSLREASLNAQLLRAAQQSCLQMAQSAPQPMSQPMTGGRAPPEIRLDIFSGMGALALFNPDLEAQPSAGVQALRAAVVDADALLIASPEYAHGVSGVMKNALDWLVSCEGFVGKPVAVLNASPRARLADAALREILRTMSALVVEEASLTVPLLGSGLSEQDLLASALITGPLRASLVALRAAVLSQEDRSGPSFALP